MPRIKDVPGPYWSFFYSFDFNEPIRVHVRREKKTCKFWLDPLELASNHGFSSKELNAIRRRIDAQYETIVEAWYEQGG